MRSFFLFAITLLGMSCTKQVDNETRETTATTLSSNSLPTARPKPISPTPTFVNYTIQKDAHYCDQNALKAVSGTAMNFVVNKSGGGR